MTPVTEMNIFSKAPPLKSPAALEATKFCNPMESTQ
jgi:hypothetical protein